MSIFPTTFMLRVSFSPVPECAVPDCWNRAFPTPPCHQDHVVVIIIIVLYRLFVKACYVCSYVKILNKNTIPLHWGRNSFFPIKRPYLDAECTKINDSSANLHHFLRRLWICYQNVFLKSEFLGFTGSVFMEFSLKTSRQAPAATAWEKKKEVS